MLVYVVIESYWDGDSNYESIHSIWDSEVSAKEVVYAEDLEVAKSNTEYNYTTFYYESHRVRSSKEESKKTNRLKVLLHKHSRLFYRE